jgi:MYXO-CTERM domain-containing protein
VGVARPVHGFSGGQLNEYGKYRMIRQADAHAWVEVFFPGLGWRTFDPTPASGQLAPPDQGVAAWLRQIADQATLVWYQWVVEYDLERQIEVFKSLTSAFKGLKGPGKSNPFLTGGDSQAGKVEPPQPSTGLPWPVLVLAALAVLGGLWWLRRRQEHGSALDPVLAGAAHRLERSLAERGLARQPWETWALVAARVAAIDGEAGPWLQKFATAWDRARFGPSPSPADRRSAADLATMATRTLRRKRK